MTKANEAFATLYEAGPKPPSILVRSGFVARTKSLAVRGDRDPVARSKPPAATLIRSRGLALRLELGLLFSKQCSSKTGARILPVDAKGDELGLINLFATGTRRKGKTSYLKLTDTMRALQVRKALSLLADKSLVDLRPEEAGRSPYDTMWLNAETRPAAGKSPARYTKPTSGEPMISIPIEFFTNGWIQVLTDSEIWNWLAFRHRGSMSSADIKAATDVRLDADVRLRYYDLTRDAWDTHLMLDRYGLMTANHGEITSEKTSSGKQRFRKEPHEFDLDDKALAYPAHPTVSSSIAAMRDEILQK